VGFRWWTRSQAQRLGVSGTVCNLDDGTVEVQARGDPEQMAEFRRMLQQGPPGAQVQRVDEDPADGVPTDGFEIIH
jgi:acylphosphatase